MEKIEKMLPERVPILGGKVIVSEKAFKEMINTINKQSEVINKLMDCIEELGNHLDASDKRTDKLQKAIENLANAILFKED